MKIHISKSPSKSPSLNIFVTSILIASMWSCDSLPTLKVAFSEEKFIEQSDRKNFSDTLLGGFRLGLTKQSVEDFLWYSVIKNPSFSYTPIGYTFSNYIYTINMFDRNFEFKVRPFYKDSILSGVYFEHKIGGIPYYVSEYYFVENMKVLLLKKYGGIWKSKKSEFLSDWKSKDLPDFKDWYGIVGNLYIEIELKNSDDFNSTKIIGITFRNIYYDYFYLFTNRPEQVAITLDSIHPKTAVDYYNRGKEKAMNKNFVGSIEDLSIAIRMDSRNSDYFFIRADAKILNKQLIPALADLNQGLILTPRSAHGYFLRGEALFLLKDFKGAIDDFNQSIEINPDNSADNSWNYYYRGIIRIKNGWRDAGLDDLSKAGKLGNTDAYSYLQNIR